MGTVRLLNIPLVALLAAVGDAVPAYGSGGRLTSTLDVAVHVAA